VLRPAKMMGQIFTGAQTMQKYDSFQAMAAGTGQNIGGSTVGVNQTFQTVEAEQAGTQQDTMTVFNFYGDRVAPTNPALSWIMISLDAQEIGDAIGDLSSKESGTWNWLKTQSFDIVTRIGIEKKGDSKRHTIIASYNTKNSTLSVDGNVIVTFPKNETPIDGIISALGGGRPLEAGEKVIWDFVNNNPERFRRVEQ